MTDRPVPPRQPRRRRGARGDWMNTPTRLTKPAPRPRMFHPQGTDREPLSQVVIAVGSKRPSTIADVTRGVVLPALIDLVLDGGRETR